MESLEESLGEAGSMFENLMQKCWLEETETLKLPDNAIKYMNAAVASLNNLAEIGRNRLLLLEKWGLVHASTISDSSLLVAKNVIQKYALDQSCKLSRDEYEQLSRTCYSFLNLRKTLHKMIEN